MTDAKNFMVATEEASFEGLAEVRSVIEEGGYLFDIDCVSSADLFRSVSLAYPELQLQTNRRAIILKRLGFQTMSGRLDLDGKKQQFWVKRQISVDEIRAKWPTKPDENSVFPT